MEGLSTRFTNAEAGIIENICLSSAEKFVPSQRSKLIRDSYNVKRFPSSVFSFSNNVERSKDNPPRAIFPSDEDIDGKATRRGPRVFFPRLQRTDVCIESCPSILFQSFPLDSLVVARSLIRDERPAYIERRGIAYPNRE